MLLRNARVRLSYALDAILKVSAFLRHELNYLVGAWGGVPAEVVHQLPDLILIFEHNEYPLHADGAAHSSAGALRALLKLVRMCSPRGRVSA
jgi:hypothetical protein